MMQHISAIALIVPDYDVAIEFYVGVLGFDLVEDTPMPGAKRWVLVAPPGAQTRLLLAKAGSQAERDAIGNQTGGRVFLFLDTDDFERDHAAYVASGVRFLEAPRNEEYGTVAVFQDPSGNNWDLIQRKAGDQGPA